MLNWIISSSVLILIIIALRFCLKGKISLRVQYGLWILVLVRLLIPFSIGETGMSIGIWVDAVADTKEAQQVVEFAQTPLSEFSESNKDEVMDTMQSRYTPAELLETVWLAGIVVIILWFLVANLHFSYKLRKSRVFLGRAGELMNTLSFEGKLGKEGNLLFVYQTDVVETPCLYGIFSPTIYVTQEVTENEECLWHVLEHESTHYNHWDYLWSILRVMCLALHWYNPLVWCAAILSRNDAELACDEATIERLGESERASYGRTLIGLTCEKRSAVMITATTMTGSGKSIKERIALIAKKPKMAFLTIVILILLLEVAIGWTYTGAKLQYESFSEWTDTINPEELEYFSLNKGSYPHELHYEPTDEEFVQFCKLLQSIPEEDCYRRRESVGEYGEYRMYFFCGENEVLLRPLEDQTVWFVGSTEMPDFTPAGKVLIIDSPELWNYIVDTVNEKGVAEK